MHVLVVGLQAVAIVDDKWTSLMEAAAIIDAQTFIDSPSFIYDEKETRRRRRQFSINEPSTRGVMHC